ncbi:sulfatase family protein [Catalinimonas niigatensis]|uniref:sulfatase family protein n=1 Tax=Catalinimonas niigatensis TaxID=1397264 RepID=UPI002666D1DF|nr:sulfatase-like hydrolase/transferase [Catalinimonas niigatensis]WPP51983.1 sulfatase-like hydrolase/transferase [Catalinimonas niigatensis]
MKKTVKIGIQILIALYLPVMVWAQNSPPNVLIIMTDQQNADMMSCAGNKWLKTPNIDKLAAKGMRFEKAYVTNPVCSPSRFSILTGRYPTAINMRHNASKLDQDNLLEIIPESVGFAFKEAGYETFYGGKVHLPSGGKDAKTYGFDKLISLDERDDLAEKSKEFLLNRDTISPFFAFVNFINPHDICYEAIRHFPPENRAPAEIPIPLLEAVEIPDSLTEKEFFASYCPPLPDNFEPTHNEPAAIMQLKELHSFTIDARKYWKEKDWRLHRWAYHRLTERVDEQIGKVLDALENSAIRDNTIVVFTSDHGEMSASHRLEHKTVFYEESSNIPLIVWYEGMDNKGETDDQHLISNGLDLYPTLCELAGIKVPEDLPGISFVPLLQNDNKAYQARQYLFMENEIGFMARDARFKYALYDNGDEMLIDLQNDPGEMFNVAGQVKHREAQKTLKDHLLKHIAKSNVKK